MERIAGLPAVDFNAAEAGVVAPDGEAFVCEGHGECGWEGRIVIVVRAGNWGLVLELETWCRYLSGVIRRSEIVALAVRLILV